MENIGGNMTATLQQKANTKNEYGENESAWTDVQLLKGFLDYTGGDAAYKSTLKGAIEETTNIFICDYVNLQIAPAQCRLIADGKAYDVLYIDDPMNLHYQLEIFLKYNEVVQ